MRIVMLALASVAVGGALGGGMTWYELSLVEERLDLPQSVRGVVAAEDVESKPVPKLIVEGGSTFDFGTMEQNQTRDREFIIRNDGNGPLTLTFYQPSCGKCIQSEFESATVPPGGKTEVKVTYATRKPQADFSEYLELHTDDPHRTFVRLTIVGYVTTSVRLAEPELAMGTVSANEVTQAKMRLYAYQSDQIEVIKAEVADPKYREHFEFTTQPVDRDAYAEAELRARAAVDLMVSMKPGVPLGPFNQSIRIETKTDDLVDLDLPINGTVVSDVTVIGGSNYVSRSSTLLLGKLRRGEGGATQIHILVKGPYRDDVDIRVASIDPQEYVKVTVGDPVDRETTRMFPVQVEVTKETPSISRLGTQQSTAGKIVFGTTHPTAKELPLYIRFAVE